MGPLSPSLSLMSLVPGSRDQEPTLGTTDLIHQSTVIIFRHKLYPNLCYVRPFTVALCMVNLFLFKVIILILNATLGRSFPQESD